MAEQRRNSRNTKINLGLSITEKRPDGYHNLETVFYPVALEDALEIRTSPEADKKFSLHQYGMEISGNPEDNLVVKAYLLLDKEFHLCPIEIHLYKHIPSGAGLGGGSSDAAFMLKARFITTLYWRTLKLRDWVRKRTNGLELMILQRTKNRYLTKKVQSLFWA